MSSKLEPTIWSPDTGQRIPWFDRCQLIITWIIKEVCYKPRLYVSDNLVRCGMAVILSSSGTHTHE